MLAGLVSAGDLGYLGAFNVPHGDVGNSTFEYGGTAIAHNPANNSLFMVGHDWDQNIAELSIPELGTGSLGQIPTAGVIQPLTPVLNRVPNHTLDAHDTKLGGLMVDGNRLIGSAYEFYDADLNAVDSHFTLSSTDLDSATVSGLHQVGDMGGGYVGGYMAKVPAEWQDEIGAPYLTGQAALSIISRTSAGPAAFGFNPANLGDTPAHATPLVNYPLQNPLAPETTKNPLFNTTTEITGVVFPEGTDSVLFVGSHGTGDWWYGEADEGGFDPYRTDKGPHAPEYVYQVWAYDVHDLLAVKAGDKQPWEIQPYDVWDFDLPYPEGGKHIGGVAYDSATGRMYVSQQYGNEAYPVVHAFQVGTPGTSTPTPNPTPEPTPEPVPEPTPEPVNQGPSGVTLDNLIHSLPEMTPIVGNLRLADIFIADDGLGTNDLSLTGADRGYFSIVGTSLYLKGGVKLDYETKAAYDVTVHASDASLGEGVSVVYTLNITDVNDAPVLDNAPDQTLGTIYEDPMHVFGTSISQLVQNAVTDQDAGALKGIAVTAASDMHGTWQYTLNGMTWQSMGQPTLGAALLLPAEGMTQVRFLPKLNFNGTVKLWYSAWDRTQGFSGGTLATAGNRGGDKSLSIATESAALTILAVNDAPTLRLSGTVGYKLNSSAIVLAPSANVADVDSPNFSGGELRVTIYSGGDAGNRLEASGLFKFHKGKVLYDGLTIGTLESNGIGLNALVIKFNSRATPEIVQELVRSLTFRTWNSKLVMHRMISFQLSDGDGGASIIQQKTVAVSSNTSTHTWL